MKVREYCYVKRSKITSVVLRYIQSMLNFWRYLLQAQSIKYILVVFGLAPAAGIIINKV